jgi:serine/threonine protein kinase
LHLLSFFGNGSGYPAELSRLVGYYAEDAAQPFILFAPYRGNPVADMARKLNLDPERYFQASLIRAIRLLEIAGVVHGRIRPETVRWDADGESVQLTDFGEAAMTGDPRREGGDAPWAAAEQVSGTGLADARDDVWSAAQVIYYIATGRHARRPGLPTDPSPRGAALQSQFGPALMPDIASRVRAKDLLGKLGGTDPRPARDTVNDPRFEEGQLKFDEWLEIKFPLPQASQTSSTGQSSSPGSRRKPTVPPRRGGFWSRFSTSLIAVAGIAALFSRWWNP